MSLSADQEKFLKSIYKNLRDRPLEPDDPFYEPIYERCGGEDPVSLMLKHIKWSDLESIQMFSGFRGAGKTSELYRLKRQLESAGYVVLYGDALEYLNPAEEIDITDLLMFLAGSFSDALEREQLANLGEDSYWARLTRYFTKTQIELDEAGLNAGLDQAGLKAGAALKLKLKSAPSFRQQLQAKLANSIGELKQGVDQFFQDGVKAIKEKRGDDLPGVVFLFDQLEQIRGSLSNEESVIRSVERLFAQHAKLLEIPWLHMVYTVPPWLKFVMPNVARIEILPSIQQWRNDAERTRYAAGWTALRSLVQRRFGSEGLRYFFGAKGQKPSLADTLIDVCGGHFRDLLLLLRETVLRVDSLPVSEETVQSAIASVRSNFLPIAIDDAK